MRNHLYRTNIWVRVARFFIMIVLSGLLLLSVLPTTYFDWHTSEKESPAQPGSIAGCIWNRFYEGGTAAIADTGHTIAFQSMIFTATLVCISFIIHAPKQFRFNILKKPYKFLKASMESITSRPLLKAEDQHTPLFRIAWISVLVVIRLYLDIFTSMAFEVRHRVLFIERLSPDESA